MNKLHGIILLFCILFIMLILSVYIGFSYKEGATTAGTTTTSTASPTKSAGTTTTSTASPTKNSTSSVVTATSATTSTSTAAPIKNATTPGSTPSCSCVCPTTLAPIAGAPITPAQPTPAQLTSAPPSLSPALNPKCNQSVNYSAPNINYKCTTATNKDSILNALKPFDSAYTNDKCYSAYKDILIGKGSNSTKFQSFCDNTNNSQYIDSGTCNCQTITKDSAGTNTISCKSKSVGPAGNSFSICVSN